MQRRSLFEGGLSLLLYQSGRILTYTVLGFIAGWIGQTFSIIANQKLLSISVGIILIVVPIIQFSAKYGKVLNKMQFGLINPVSKLTSKVFKLPFWEFFAGAINGIIPCGMVYLAVATAINSANATGGAQFMFLFGLGTLPLLMMISLGGIYLKRFIRFNTNRLIPWFMLFVGMLLILRASELGIPFISPYTNTHFSKAAICE